LIALDQSPFPQAMMQRMKQQAQASMQAAPPAPPDPVAQAETAKLSASAILKNAQTQKVQAQLPA
jgi:hypothetical protein